MTKRRDNDIQNTVHTVNTEDTGSSQNEVSFSASMSKALHEKLVYFAEMDRRSQRQEIVYILQEYIRDNGPRTEVFYTPIGDDSEHGFSISITRNMHNQLTAFAKRDRRSLRQQVIYIIEAYVAQRTASMTGIN